MRQHRWIMIKLVWIDISMRTVKSHKNYFKTLVHSYTTLYHCLELKDHFETLDAVNFIDRKVNQFSKWASGIQYQKK